MHPNKRWMSYKYLTNHDSIFAKHLHGTRAGEKAWGKISIFV